MKHIERVAFFAIALVLLTRLSLFSFAIVCAFFVLQIVFRRNESIQFLLFGILIPLLPVFSSPILLTATICLLLLHELPTEDFYRGTVPFLAILGIWSAVEIALDFDPAYWGEVLGNSGKFLLNGEFFTRLQQSPPPEIIRIENFARVLVLIGLASRVTNQKVSTNIVTGLIVGLLVSVGLTILQIRGFLVFPHQVAYWSNQSRWTGTFTDPNAFGVFVALAVPLLLYFRSRVPRIMGLIVLPLIVALLSIGVFSGSRTFILGIILTVAIAAFQYSRRIFLGCAALIVLIIGVLNAGIVNVSALPIALQRVSSSITFGHIAESLFSRIIFWKVGITIWLENLSLGIGYGNFRSYVVPYVTSRGLDLNLWTDNANNFYLGILAECGIVGIIGFLFSAMHFRWRENETSGYHGRESINWREVNWSRINWDRCGLVVLGAILFIGPHLDFDEVTVIGAILLGTAVTYDSKRLWPRLESSSGLKQFATCASVAVLIVITSGITFKAFQEQRGFYPWEKSISGEFYRWSAVHSQGMLRCRPDNTAPLHINAVRPVTLFPVLMNVTDERNISKNYVLSETKKDTTLVLPCAYPERARFNLTVLNSWSPGTSEDNRILGVQIVSEEGPTAPLP